MRYEGRLNLTALSNLALRRIAALLRFGTNPKGYILAARGELATLAGQRGCITMNQGDLAIRPARAEDAPAITECVAAAYRHYITRLGKPPGPMLDDYKEVIQQHRVLVLIDGAKILGVLVLIPQTQSLLVDNVAVHPGYQNRGLGRKLMALAEEEARRLGFTTVTLYTNERMTENIELYKKLGYRKTERKTEQGYQRVYMRKALPDETS